MRLIWILFSLKSGPYLIQFCLTWRLPWDMNRNGISVDVESIKHYSWTDLKPRLAYPAELENVNDSRRCLFRGYRRGFNSGNHF